ncbi:PEGA domain-containing protein [Haliangium ochraceum]|uniref:PEGA domain protein n=1 Tax=Haliangium ochraceum (strain DSM 14365 / JCM 11303 / SMP-2) TaxID=502025 RepID=D0LY11_HALO1|nr:PEGA domain-containing protein [Haliangium ochraceum]ACY14366.1 PEGA domain protein [Haliangium ochraceum DSM 14365]
MPAPTLRCWATLLAACLCVAALGGNAARAEAPAPAPAPIVGEADEPQELLEIESCMQPLDLDAREAENRAADHYDRGIQLYEQGDYEAAIEEFVSAYCLKPYYRVLKDIAQSFERMVNYEKAVIYLERYLAGMPADEVEERRVQRGRVEVLRRLPARIRVATSPAGATVTLRDAGRVEARALADDDTPIAIRKGRYLMSVEHDGYETITRPIAVEIGQPYSFYFQLQPKTGSLRINATPGDARIFVDKRWVGVGSYVGELPLGVYQVEVELDGYVRQTQEITIDDIGAHRMAITLEPQPRSGRGEMIAAASAGGSLAVGLVAGSLFRGQRGLAAGTGLALGGGLGFAGTYLSVPGDLPVGHSSFIIGSSLISAFEAGLSASLVERLFLDESCSDDDRMEGAAEDGFVGRVNVDSCRSRVILGASIVGGISGALFALASADYLLLDEGDVAVVHSGALWGTIAGGLLWFAFDRAGDRGDVLTLATLNMGLATGGFLAARGTYSRSHVSLVDLGGLGGLLAGATSSLVFYRDSFEERAPHFALVGTVVGLALSSYLTRNMDDPDIRAPQIKPLFGRTEDAAGRSVATVGASLRW